MIGKVCAIAQAKQFSQPADIETFKRKIQSFTTFWHQIRQTKMIFDLLLDDKKTNKSWGVLCRGL